MNKYLSTVGLYARWNLYPVLVIILVTVLAAGIMTYRVPIGEVTENMGVDSETGETMQAITVYGKLEGVAAKGHAPVVCAAGFAAIAAVMSLTGCGYGVKSGYTVRRLRVKERRAALLWSGYHAALLVIFWALLAAVLYGVMALRLGADVTYEHANYHYGPQSLLLLCYDDTFLHHLIPLRDTAVWALGITSVLAVSLSSVAFACCQRQGKFNVLILAAVGLTILSFFYDMGRDTLFILLVLLLAVAGGALVTILRGDGDET